MATGLLPYRPLAVKATAPSASRRSPSSSSSSSNNWWAPIFGFSSEPGYVDSVDNKVAYPRKGDREGSSLSAAHDDDGARCRPDPIRFTEEKARLLRLMTSDEAASLPDAMYHSAIASRLASDFGNPTDP